MTLTRILLASTTISLSSLGYAHAASFSHAQPPAVSPPAVSLGNGMQQLTRVQMSVAEAEVKLQAAQERKAEAEATGGDVATAQAEVDAAQAELEAAQTTQQPSQPAAQPPAAEQPAAPAPTAEEPETEPQAAEKPTSQTAEEAPSAAGEPEAEPMAVEEPASQASEETPPANSSPEPAAETTQPAVEDPAVQAGAPEAPVAAETEIPAPVTEESSDATGQETQTAPAATDLSGEVAPQSEQPAASENAEPAAEEPAAETPAADPQTSETDPAEPVINQPGAEDPVATQAEPAAPAAEEETSEAPMPEGETAAEPESDQAEDAPVPAENSQAPESGTTDSASPDASAEPTAEGTEADAQAETTAPAIEEEVLTLPVENGAPVLDSAKEDTSPEASEGQPAATAAPSEPAAPPPSSDAEAQAPESRNTPAPEAMAEEGERVDEAPAHEAQTNVTIINQTDNRTIIQVDNRTIVEHDERERLRAGSEEVYYERLRGGRVREVIVRPNGVQLVTITNRWGDVIQRSRIMPDGREYVLFYAEASSDGSRNVYVDPGRELPPLRLGIPIADYILDATEADPSAFFEFLLEPPVERVERLYSVEEVRRSARVRDKVRRVDLDSLTFEFGKATIPEDQIQRLSDVANAMSKILDRNPAETFLIEGHTDAVGRDEANLLLSDKRAETIAVALSNVFGIPPENLITQGYGERYLKVRTEAPERLNRRVTIRRITPLVTPVASR